VLSGLGRAGRNSSGCSAISALAFRSRKVLSRALNQYLFRDPMAGRLAPKGNTPFLGRPVQTGRRRRVPSVVLGHRKISETVSELPGLGAVPTQQRLDRAPPKDMGAKSNGLSPIQITARQTRGLPLATGMRCLKPARNLQWKMAGPGLGHRRIRRAQSLSGSR
jgi:hypothetical protein